MYLFQCVWWTKEIVRISAMTLRFHFHFLFFDLPCNLHSSTGSRYQFCFILGGILATKLTRYISRNIATAALDRLDHRQAHASSTRRGACNQLIVSPRNLVMAVAWGAVPSIPPETHCFFIMKQNKNDHQVLVACTVSRKTVTPRGSLRKRHVSERLHGKGAVN